MSLPFEDAFRDLRISGSVLLTGAHAAPWAVDIPSEEKLRTLLRARGDQKVIPFHLVRKGHFDLIGKEAGRRRIYADEVAICAGGAAHQMRLGGGARAIPFERILSGEAPPPRWNGEARMTELICGVFIVARTPLNPLLSALPSVLVCATGGARANPTLSRVAELLALEVSASDRRVDGFTCGRLLEIFCAEAIRAHQAALPSQTPSWLRGLNDPVIAKALAQIHANPASNWTVDQLAANVALSPSRFAARFRDTVGETVMVYVARWRMNLACRLMRESRDTIENIAVRVGYAGTAAFTRAFKDKLGCTPAKWRLESAGSAMPLN